MVWGVLLVMGVLSASGTAGNYRNRKREIVQNSDIFQNCSHPCKCPENEKECEECLVCSRQLGGHCSQHNPCDQKRGLTCVYRHGDVDGICQDAIGLPCLVYNKTYEHGETFSLDCRTQCTCQNGTYGCSSLCPQERISPKGSCRHPRLVDVPGQCCREWMCDSQTEQPPACLPSFTKWTSCSNECGIGLSTRKSNLNDRCQMESEVRLCQDSRCDNQGWPWGWTHHHIRRGHECKATQRVPSPMVLRFGPCRSRKRFRPKYCGFCPRPGVVCQPLLSTTVRVEFACEGLPHPGDRPSAVLLAQDLQGDMWVDEEPPHATPDSTMVTFSVQWVLKCRCSTPEDTRPTLSTGEVVLHRVHRTAAP